VVDGQSEGVATITLNRPEKRNALSIAVRDAVSDALDRLAADDECKVVVVTGAGEVFSAGFDLREFEEPELADELPAVAAQTAEAIARAPRDVLLRTKAKFVRRAGVANANTLDL
jgi:enoyl-CoA hydratase